MKQQPTLKEWHELDEQKRNLFACTLIANGSMESYNCDTFTPTIGQMIEYLGEGLIRIDQEKPDKALKKLKEQIWGEDWTWVIIGQPWGNTTANELADALLEAVKYKTK